MGGGGASIILVGIPTHTIKTIILYVRPTHLSMIKIIRCCWWAGDVIFGFNRRDWCTGITIMVMIVVIVIVYMTPMMLMVISM